MCAAGGFISRIIITTLVAWSSEIRVLAYTLLLGALSFVAVPFFYTTVMLAAIAFVFGFGLNCSQPLVLTLLYSRSPEGRAGEALGLRFSLDNGVKCIGPVLFGVAAATFGVGAVFWINALVLTTGGAITRFNSGPIDKK
jgi:predicted MFS family arabinose efflux permease